MPWCCYCQLKIEQSTEKFKNHQRFFPNYTLTIHTTLYFPVVLGLFYYSLCRLRHLSTLLWFDIRGPEITLSWVTYILVGDKSDTKSAEEKWQNYEKNNVNLWPEPFSLCICCLPCDFWHHPHTQNISLNQNRVMPTPTDISDYLRSEAVSVSSYLAQFFMREARRSGHTFPSRWDHM